MQLAKLQHQPNHRCEPHNKQDKHESSIKNATLVGE